MAQDSLNPEEVTPVPGIARERDGFGRHCPPARNRSAVPKAHPAATFDWAEESHAQHAVFKLLGFQSLKWQRNLVADVRGSPCRTESLTHRRGKKAVRRWNVWFRQAAGNRMMARAFCCLRVSS